MADEQEVTTPAPNPNPRVRVVRVLVFEGDKKWIDNTMSRRWLRQERGVTCVGNNWGQELLYIEAPLENPSTLDAPTLPFQEPDNGK